MAVIQIPMGGGQIGIDVPDFAMEATQQDIAAYAAQQVTALNAIAVKIGANLQGQTTQNQNANRNSQQQQQQLQQQTTILGGVRQLLSSAGGKIGAAMSSVQNDSELSVMTEKVFKTLNLPELGAAMGTIVGIFEEFGNQMSSFGRIGAGVGLNLIGLRNDAASVGLSMTDLAKISTESGAAMSSLGNNTTDGVNKFVKFTSAFRDATREFGYFGMASTEMAQFTADELELRRQMYDTEYNRNLNEQDLAVQMKENLNLQSAMARITGQDVRARIKAQQDFQKDAINASIMATLTADQQKAVKAAASGFSQLGSAGEVVADAFRMELAGLPKENAKGYAELQAVLSSAGVDISSSIDQMVSGARSGMSEETISAAADALAGSIKNIPVDKLGSLNILALSGVEGAQLALTARVETIASGADSIEESTGKIATALEAMATAVQDRSALIMGLQANTEQFVVGLRADITNAILLSLGIDPSNVDAANAAIGGASSQLAALPKDSRVEKLMNTIVGGIFRIVGATTVAGPALDAAGINGRPGQGLPEYSMWGALAAQGFGQEEAAAILKAPMMILNAIEAGKAVSDIMSASDATAGSIAGLGNAANAAATAFYDAQDVYRRLLNLGPGYRPDGPRDTTGGDVRNPNL